MVPRIEAITQPGAAAASVAEPTVQRIAPSLDVAVRAQVAFADVLQRVHTTDTGGIQFSSRAQRRLQSRSIPFGWDELQRLTQAVDRAESKGARDSLILIDELALVVNIKNRVVVTAIDKESRKDSIFTNIDSVVMT